MAINTGTNFKVQATLPIDVRTVVNTVTDLNTLENTYEGLFVWVKDTNKLYVFTSDSTYEEFRTSPLNYVTTDTDQTITGLKSFTKRPTLLVAARVPTEYQEVEYLQFSGTTYINTGIIPTTFDYSIEFRGAFSTPAGGPNCAWGFMGTSTLPRWVCATYSNKYLLNANNTVQTAMAADTEEHTFICRVYNDSTYNVWDGFIDNFPASGPQTITSQESWTANTLAIYLGARNNNGTAGNFSAVTVKEYKVTKNGTIIQHLIPCYRKSDTKPGMYDLISNTFYVNSGTGEFTYGSDIVSKQFVVHSDLAAVATTGNYEDLTNRPTIPAAPNNGVLTISQLSGNSVFTANQAGNTNITVNAQSVLGFNPENSTNKTTSWSTTPDNTKYPGEKLVKDELDNIREIAEGKTSTYVGNIANNPALDSQADSIEISAFTDITGTSVSLDKFKLGDNIYVTDQNVPDRWVSCINTSTVPTGYTGLEWVLLNETQYTNCINTGLRNCDTNKVIMEIKIGQGAAGNPIYISTFSGKMAHAAPYLAISSDSGFSSVNRNPIYSLSEFQSDFRTQTVTFSSSDTGSLSFGAWQDNTWTAPIYVKSLKFYNNNTLLRDFRPCIQISTSTVGFYDVVTSAFFAEASGDSLTAGPVHGGGVITSLTLHKLETAKAPVANVTIDTTSIVDNNKIANIETTSGKTILGTTGGTYNEITNTVVLQDEITSLVTTNEINQTIKGQKYFTTRPVLSITSTLPTGYTELEFIETQGASWINTGKVGHANWHYEIDFQQTVASQYRVWGVFNQAAYDGYNMSLTYGSNKWMLRFNFTSSGIEYVDLPVIDTARHLVKILNGVVYFDNISYGTTQHYDSSYTFSYHPFLGTINPAGTAPTASAYAKFYSYKVWDANNTLVQNFVPAKNSSNVVGMYDTVDNIFYPSITATAFIAGPTKSAQSPMATQAEIPTVPTNVSSFTNDIGYLPEAQLASKLGKLNTNNTTSQTVATNESFTTNINLHKISKTGDFDDLVDKPKINTDISTTLTPGTEELHGFSSGELQLHKISKTGSYTDLLNLPDTLLKKGDLPANTDLNNLNNTTDVGVWNINNITVVHGPISGSIYGSFIQFPGDYKSQLFIAGGTGECRIYTRRFLTGTQAWTDWLQMATPEDIPKTDLSQCVKEITTAFSDFNNVPVRSETGATNGNLYSINGTYSNCPSVYASAAIYGCLFQMAGPYKPQLLCVSGDGSNDIKMWTRRYKTSASQWTDWAGVPLMSDLPTKATTTEISNKSDVTAYIAPNTMDYAVREGLGNSSLTWNDTYKAAARTTIGAGTSNFSGNYDDLINKRTKTSEFTNDGADGTHPFISLSEVPQEIYWCTYGTTTYAEITTALAASKVPMVTSNGITFTYLGIISSKHYFGAVSDRRAYRVSVDSSNTWVYNHDDFEFTYNKISVLSSSSTNAQYPGAKCVYDAIDDVREIAEGKTKNYVTNTIRMPVLNSTAETIQTIGSITILDGTVIDINKINIGDNILVTDTDISDRWVSSFVLGSNLLDVPNSRLAQVGTLQADGSYLVTSCGSIGIWSPGYKIVFNGETNKQYKMTGQIKSDSSSSNIALGWLYSDGTIAICGNRGTYTSFAYQEGTSAADKTVVGVGVYYAGGENIYIKDLEIKDADATVRSGLILNKLETTKVPITSISENGISRAIVNGNVDIEAVDLTSNQLDINGNKTFNGQVNLAYTGNMNIASEVHFSKGGSPVDYAYGYGVGIYGNKMMCNEIYVPDFAYKTASMYQAGKNKTTWALPYRDSGTAYTLATTNDLKLIFTDFTLEEDN